jgi:MoxR-like ATPase
VSTAADMKPLQFENVEDASRALEGVGYLPSREIATSAFLADRLGKPVLIEGPAGVGKTEFALALAKSLGRELVRLQCYEGLDESKALYEWEYAKQLLYTQLLKDKIGESIGAARTISEAADRIAGSDAVFFSERFLLPRPILRALISETPSVLLVDEIDKADPEFEAFLLEVLADNAVTIPELGTFKAKHVPRVVLTSNNARELSDALKRRCLHLYMDFPSRDRELRILRKRLPDISEALLGQVVEAIGKIRALDLKKPPSISETLDWAQSLALLNADALSSELVAATLNVVLKHEGDIEKARAQLPTIAG